MPIIRATCLAAILYAALLIALNVVGLAAVPWTFIALAFTTIAAIPTLLAMVFDVLIALSYANARKIARDDWEP